MESESVIKGQTSLGESNNNNNNNSNGNGNFAISRNDIINQANKFNDRLSEEYKSIELHEEDLNIVSNLLSIIFERMSDKEQIEKDDSAFYHNYSLNFATEEPFDLRIKNMIWMSTRHGVSTIERIHFIHLLSDLLYVLKISSLRSTTHFTEKVREGMIDLANNFVLFKSLPSILQRRQLSFRELELIYRVAASTVIEWSDVGLLALRRILHASWCKGTNPLSHLNIEDKLRMEFTFDLTNEIYLNLEKLLNVCVHVLFIKAKEYEPYELDLSYVKKRQIRKAIHLFQANAAYMRFARMRCIARFQDSLAHFKNEREAYEFSLNALEACKQYYKSMLSTEQKHSKANSSTSLCSVEAKLLEPPTSSERPTIVVPSVIDIIEENPDKEIEDILGKPSEEESRYATATAAAAAKLEHNVNHKSNVKSDDNNTSKNSVNEEVNVEVGSIPTSRFSGFTADVMQMSDFIIGLLSHPYTANNPKLLKEAVEVYELYVEQLIMETHGRLSSIKVTLLSNALNFCMNDWEKFMQHLAYNQGEETYYRLRNKLKELAVVNLECFIEPSPMWMSSFNFVNQKSYNSATNQNFMSKVPFLATNKGKKVLHEVTFLLGRYMRALCMLSTLGISIDTLSDANVIEHNLITALKYVSTIETLEERNLVELIRFCTIVCDTGYLKENLLKAMLVALRKITNEAVIRNINDFFRARVLRDL